MIKDFFTLPYKHPVLRFIAIAGTIGWIIQIVRLIVFICYNN